MEHVAGGRHDYLRTKTSSDTVAGNEWQLNALFAMQDDGSGAFKQSFECIGSEGLFRRVGFQDWLSQSEACNESIKGHIINALDRHEKKLVRNRRR